MAVFPLVDKKTRFLSFKEIDKQTVAMLANLPLVRLGPPHITIFAPARHGGTALVEYGLYSMPSQ